MIDLTDKDLGVVKLAAAQRYAELGIRPQTATYLFDRYHQKRAEPLPLPAVSPKVMKLAHAMAAQARAARATK